METGFDCEFVDTISKDIQTECSICLLILRQPHIVSCCGYRFCGTCLGRIQQTPAPSCPLCKQTFHAIPDKGLERVLSAKSVSCSFRESGCEWVGELSQFESHLNRSLLEGCPYVEIICPRCQSKSVQRQKMKEHIDHECPKREVVCRYCKKHRSSYECMVRIHHLVCPYIPVLCPKICSAKPQRKNVASHVANTCPKNPQTCPFSVVGCTKTLTRNRMENHLKDRSVLSSHMSLVEKSQENLRNQLRERDALVSSLQDEKRDRETKMLEFSVELVRSNDVHEREVKMKNDEISALEHEVKEKSSWISALTKEVKDKDRQIEELQRKSSRDNHALERQNSALQKKAHVQKAEIDKLTEVNHQIAEDLHKTHVARERALVKEDYTKSLERQITELRKEVDGRTMEAKRLRAHMAHAQQLEVGGSNSGANEGAVPGNHPPGRSTPSDENGVLGAALGVALSVGIVGVTALFRR